MADTKKPSNNATSAKPSGSVPKDSELIPLAKRIAMGQHPETGSGTGKNPGC